MQYPKDKSLKREIQYIENQIKSGYTLFLLKDPQKAEVIAWFKENYPKCEFESLGFEVFKIRGLK